MTTIATLTIDLLAESAQFRSELRRANKSTDDWSKKVRQSARTAATALAGMGVAAATGVAALYTVNAQSIDQQTKFADKIGITTKALAGLQHAGDLTGVSTNAMNMGLQRMTRRVAEAANGTGEAVGALDDLGLSAQSLTQLSPDQQFMAIADAMGNVEGRSEQVRLAFKLFDSEGTALLNTLDAGAGGIAAMVDEADRLALGLTRIDAAKVEQANDAFDKATKVSTGFSRQLTAELAPIVQGVSDKFLQSALNAGGMGEVATMATNAIVKGLDVVYVGLLSMENGWNVIKVASLTAARGAVEALAWMDEAVTSFLNNLPGVEATASETLGNLLNYLKTESSAAMDEVAASSSALATQMVAIFDGNGAVKQITEEWRATADATAAATAASKEYGEQLAAQTIVAANDSVYTDKDKERLENELLRLEESLMSETELIDLYEQQKFEKLQEFRDADVVDFQRYTDLKKQIEVKAEADRKKLVAKSRSEQLQNAGQLFDGLAGMTKTFAGEQSGIFKAMFVVSKAFAIADSIMKIQQGIANAAALPFPANIGAMASVAAATANIVSSIQSVQMEGMAHDGIDSIPREGTWLLDKGERVVDSRTNQDLKSYLSTASNSGGGQSPQVVYAPQITVEAGASQDADSEMSEDIARQGYALVLEDIQTNGPIRQSLSA